MITIITLAYWPIVVMFLLVRADKLVRQWLQSQEPLSQKQEQALSRRIDELHNQMTKLTLRKEFNE